MTQSLPQNGHKIRRFLYVSTIFIKKTWAKLIVLAFNTFCEIPNRNQLQLEGVLISNSSLNPGHALGLRNEGLIQT